MAPRPSSSGISEWGPEMEMFVRWRYIMSEMSFGLLAPMTVLGWLADILDAELGRVGKGVNMLLWEIAFWGSKLRQGLLQSSK